MVLSEVPCLLARLGVADPCDAEVPSAGASRDRFHIRHHHPVGEVSANRPCAANAASDSSIAVASSDLPDWVVQGDPAAVVKAGDLPHCWPAVLLDSVPLPVAVAVDWAFRPAMDCVVMLSSCLAAASGVVVAAAVEVVAGAAVVAAVAGGTADTEHAEAAAWADPYLGNVRLEAYSQAVAHTQGTETSVDSCSVVGTVVVIVQPAGTATACPDLHLVPSYNPHRRAAVAAAYVGAVAAGNCPVPDASEAVVVVGLQQVFAIY